MKRIIGRKLVYACKKCGKPVDSATADVFKDDSICRKCLIKIDINLELERKLELEEQLLKERIKEIAPYMFSIVRNLLNSYEKSLDNEVQTYMIELASLIRQVEKET